MTGDALVAAKPAQEAIDTLSVSPKPANLESSNRESAETKSAGEADVATDWDRSRTVIALASLKTNAEAADTTAAPRPADGLVTVRPKPERRKNYKERAKEKAKGKDFKKGTEGGTTPDTTATAKSRVQEKVKDKVDAKAAAKARTKAEAKKARKTRKTRSAARTAA